MFIIFCAALLQRQVPPDWWGYILLGGYSFGAVGLGSLILEEEQKQQAGAFLTLQGAPQPDVPPALPSPPAEPCQFASWDDEENER